MASSQNFVKIKAVKDGVVFLGLNKICAILEVSSLNFELKSAEEREAIIYAYQDFLNSLDFPIQIVVVSRKVNIDSYLKNLEEIAQKEEQEQLRLQIQEYIDFIKALTENTDVLSKSFYVVVPYSSVEHKKQGIISKIFKRKESVAQNITGENFLQFKTQLWERVQLVSEGLKRCGLKVVPLKTQEIIELFYNLYNPQKKPRENLPDIQKLEIRMQ